MIQNDEGSSLSQQSFVKDENYIPSSQNTESFVSTDSQRRTSSKVSFNQTGRTGNITGNLSGIIGNYNDLKLEELKNSYDKKKRKEEKKTSGWFGKRNDKK